MDGLKIGGTFGIDGCCSTPATPVGPARRKTMIVIYHKHVMQFDMFGYVHFNHASFPFLSFSGFEDQL